MPNGCPAPDCIHCKFFRGRPFNQGEPYCTHHIAVSLKFELLARRSRGSVLFTNISPHRVRDHRPHLDRLIARRSAKSDHQNEDDVAGFFGG